MIALHIGSELTAEQLKEMGFPEINGKPVSGTVVNVDQYHYHVDVVAIQPWLYITFFGLPMKKTYRLLFPRNPIS